MYELCTSISLGTSKTNLTLASSLFDKNNSLIASGITTNFYELGNGNYIWDYASFPSNFRGFSVIHQSGTYPGGINVLSCFPLNPEDAENLDVKVSSVSNITIGSYQIIIITKDQGNNIIGNTTVEIYPSGVGALLQKTTTNMSNGQALFNLDTGNYRLYTYNPTVAYWSNPTYISASANASVDIIGSTISVSPPINSSLVRLYAYIYDLGLDQLDSVELMVVPSGFPSTINDSLIIKKQVTGSSDINGYVYTDIAANLPVRIRIPKANVDFYTICPSSGSLNIASLLD